MGFFAKVCLKLLLLHCVPRLRGVHGSIIFQGINNAARKIDFCVRFSSYQDVPDSGEPRDSAEDSCRRPRAASIATQWCVIATFIKWAWVVFQLDISQVRAASRV